MDLQLAKANMTVLATHFVAKLQVIFKRKQDNAKINYHGHCIGLYSIWLRKREIFGNWKR